MFYKFQDTYLAVKSMLKQNTVHLKLIKIKRTEIKIFFSYISACA